MFTGIVQAMGRLQAREVSGDGARFTVAVPQGFLAQVGPGASIAVNGVCLTATSVGEDCFSADVSGATLEVTTLGTLVAGAGLNLEHPATLATALGGHLVTGHVDGVARLASVEAAGESTRMRFTVPGGLAHYVARKGSVCVDGVSLTVNEVERDGFEVNIVPHTMAATCLRTLAVGDPVNLEVDLVARYVERLMERDK